ncbi:1511_t:CDS:2, partial [Ambispora leptoticha]
MRFLRSLGRRTLEESGSDTIAVTNCDHWFGYVLAWSLLEIRHDKNYNVRVLTRTRNKYTDDLDKKGAEIFEIDYGRSETLETALGHVGWLVVVPEADRDRVKWAKTLADAIKKIDVSNVITLSMLGAGDSKTRTLADFRDIEKAVEGSAKNWVTLRPSFLNQSFFVFERKIRESKQLTINAGEDARWSPVDLDDVIYVLSKFAFDNNGLLRPVLEEEHQHKIYTLTGPDLVTGPLLADDINSAIKAKPRTIKFMEVTREALEDYLLGRGNQRDRDLFRSLDRRDFHLDYPKPGKLNQIAASLILDFFEYVNTGKAGYLSGDFKDITN